jgi:hypothetical protein
MAVKFSRAQKYLSLSATNTEQDVAIGNNAFTKLIIDVTVAGAIRISINGEPETLSGGNGILIPYEKPLTLYNHVVNSISYIRDNNMISNVSFQIIGLNY